MRGRRAKERGRNVTVASIHEGEEEKKSHPRKEIQIDFPQQFLLVNHITAFFCRLSGARLVDFRPLFLFGHVWGDERRDGGEVMQVDEPHLTTAGAVYSVVAECRRGFGALPQSKIDPVDN